jgi:hypothetical protein
MNLLSSLKESLGSAAAAASPVTSWTSSLPLVGGLVSPTEREAQPGRDGSSAVATGGPSVKLDKPSSLLGTRLLQTYSKEDDVGSCLLVDRKKAAALEKRLGGTKYVRALGAVMDDPSGPFQV